MGEPEIEPREVLRRTRIVTLPYLREIAEHSRAIIPRMEVSKRWMDYYEAVGKVRPLTVSERRRLEEHRKAYDLLAARREVYRVAGRYARTKKPTDLIALRQAQSRYYESKAETLPPEREREMKEKMVPPKEVYNRLAEIKGDIEEKCKRYLGAKFRRPPYHLITIMDRYITMKSLGAVLRDLYAEAYDVSQKGKEMSELIKHYREMKELGAR
ncbi:MAG: hypothetical protein QHH17_06820 [Candidatus Bathyarchaeota archaeon]|nr:hypothetical protein [Candidatus Bathyarchaeota archaeon]